MAAFVPTTNPRPILALHEGPDEARFVAAGTYTATASQEFIVGGAVTALELTINYVKVGAAPSVVYTVEAWDIASSTWITLLTSAAIVATSVINLLIAANIGAASANVSAAHVLRRLMRVTATHGNTDTCTYSITGVSQ